MIQTSRDIELLQQHNYIYVLNNVGLRNKVIKLYYNNPLARHFRTDKTSKLLQRNYYQENIEDNVYIYYQEYNICQRVKVKRHVPYSLLRSLPQPIRPQSKILIDFITSLPECKDLASRLNFDSILIVINRYTKMAQYIVYYKTINALELAKILQEKVFSIFRTLDRIMSNCRTMFISQFWLAFYYYLMCKCQLSTTYYPQTNSQTKRQNQNLKHYL